MSEQRPPYYTAVTPPATVQIRLIGSSAAVAATAAWLRAQGLAVQSESSDRPGRQEPGQVRRYLLAGAPQVD